MQSLSRAVFLWCLAVLSAALAIGANAQSYEVIHNFTGEADGAHPQAGVTIDRVGNLYTTATGGGDYGGNCNSLGCGVVLQLIRQGADWAANPFYTFLGGSDGSLPDSGVVLGPDGTFYGTTSAGGVGNNGYGYGTVFNLQPAANQCGTVPCPWNEVVLYRFAGSNGWQPTLGNLTFDAAGNIYGTTIDGGSGSCFGGYGCGVVFELTPNGGQWTENVLYSFSGGTGGAYPQGGLVLDHAGNIYGTATSGGVGNCNAYVGGCGVIFKLAPSPNRWTETVLYSFTGGGDGGVPEGGLVFGPSGALYGTTESGGTGNNGTVFELSPTTEMWEFNTLYSFPGAGLPGPTASVAVDRVGNLYGTTLSGPPDYPPCDGSVFKLSRGAGWNYSLLYCFTGGSDGGEPYSPVTLDANGNLYGTAYAGGAYGDGVVWKIAP